MCLDSEKLASHLTKKSIKEFHTIKTSLTNKKIRERQSSEKKAIVWILRSYSKFNIQIEVGPFQQWNRPKGKLGPITHTITTLKSPSWNFGCLSIYLSIYIHIYSDIRETQTEHKKISGSALSGIWRRTNAFFNKSNPICVLECICSPPNFKDWRRMSSKVEQTRQPSPTCCTVGCLMYVGFIFFLVPSVYSLEIIRNSFYILAHVQGCQNI